MRAFRRICLTILLCWLAQTVFAVKGRISDDLGKPIEGATVTDRQKIVFSGPGGEFEIKTNADSLYISRVGFRRQAVSARLEFLKIVMVADSIVMPTVWVRAVDRQPLSPSLSADLIHPDTNSAITSAGELLTQNAALGSNDIRLSGERQTVSILGSFGRHSLVILDGVVMNPSGEAFDLSKIPLGQISHIEIIKGNSSAYGGSAAIGGIIHIHTVQAVGKPQLEATISGAVGSFDMYRQVYGAAVETGKFSLKAEYSHQQALNDFLYDTPPLWNMEPELRRFHNRKVADSYYAKASYIRSTAQVDYSLNAGSFVRQLPGPINFLELYDDSRLTGSYAHHSLRATIAPSTLSYEVLMWANSDQSVYSNLMPSNSFGISHYLQSQSDKGIRLTNNLSLTDLNLALSLEYAGTAFEYNNRLTSGVIKGDRDNAAAAMRGQYSFYPLSLPSKLSAALRADHDGKDLHPTWRIEHETVIPAAGDLSLGAYIGTAYSRPSLFDMYWIGDSETHGNPDLTSENSFGGSLYAKLATPTLKLKVAAYQNRVEDLIQWRQYYMNGSTWKPFNVGRADLKSFELESRLQIIRVISLSGGLTYTQAQDLSRNADGSPSPTYQKALVYTPDWKGKLELAVSNDKQGAALRYSHTGRQYSTPDNLIPPLKAFGSLDGSAYVRFKLFMIDVQTDLKLNNLLDKRYDIYAYIPQPGFNWSVGITLRVKS